MKIGEAQIDSGIGSLAWCQAFDFCEPDQPPIPKINLNFQSRQTSKLKTLLHGITADSLISLSYLALYLMFESVA